MSDQLRALGIELIEGYGADQLTMKPDQFVVGNVVSRGNALLEAVLDAGADYTSGPAWLAEHVLQGRHVLAVAGTHGKTTTTAMLAWILETAGLAPGFLIGGVPMNFEVSARLGGHSADRVAASPFVIEADEYDTAFFDKRSKFVHYRPRTVVLNNLEFDHADIFDDLAAIETPVPPPGAHSAVDRPAGRQRARRAHAARAGDGLLERRCSVSVGARKSPACCAHAASRTLRRAARQPEDRTGRVVAARRAQPAQRARGHCRRRARRRDAWRGHRRAGPLQERAPTAGTARRGERHQGLRRLRAPPDGHAKHARRPAPQVSAPSASWPCSSRARTR